MFSLSNFYECSVQNQYRLCAKIHFKTGECRNDVLAMEHLETRCVSTLMHSFSSITREYEQVNTGCYRSWCRLIRLGITYSQSLIIEENKRISNSRQDVRQSFLCAAIWRRSSSKLMRNKSFQPSFLSLPKIAQIFSAVKSKKKRFMPAKIQLYIFYIFSLQRVCPGVIVNYPIIALLPKLSM